MTSTPRGALAVLFLAGCAGGGGGGSHRCDVARTTAVPPFDPESLLPLYDPATNPFAQPIGPDPALHPDSALLTQSLVEQHQEQGMLVITAKWSQPVVFVDASTPTADVALKARWSPYDALLDVPVPDWALPDPSDDGSLAIVDLDARLEYDLWRFCTAGGEVVADWANVVSLDGPGIFPSGLSGRGSGFAYMNGLIWPHELERGHIDHALYFAYDLTRAGGPVSPATESDGTSNRPDAIPEGARVQLDPSLDVGTLGLDPGQETIARALQEYGMILGDDGGGLTIYGVHELTFPESSGAWGGLLQTDRNGYSFFPQDFPSDRFRVLDYGPQDPDASADAHVEFPDRFR